MGATTTSLNAANPPPILPIAREPGSGGVRTPRTVHGRPVTDFVDYSTDEHTPRERHPASVRA